MGTKNYSNKKFQVFTSIFLISFFLLSIAATAQVPDPEENNQTEQDTLKTGFSMGQMDLPNPPSIIDLYTYDPVSGMYIYNQMLGSFSISYPMVLTQEEYQDLILEEEMKSYFKSKIDAADGRKEGTEEEQKNLLPSFYVDSNLFETIFGGNVIEVIPQGSVEMDLGLLYTKQDNPSFSPRNRSNLTFDFDQRISLSLLGKVGERLQITANYDTQSTFDFQNQIKLEYTPTEDQIIQTIEVGNVSMPLNSSLIQGAQSLFGVKTELQFGKTRVTGVFSEQKSESRSVVAQGGGTVNDFDVFALEYDEDRHFFLSHYFRDKYDDALEQYPFVNSNVQISRIEVWVTNLTNTTDNVRNIVALQDIGESDPSNIGLSFPPGGFVNRPPGSYPDNGNNDFNPFGIEGGAQSVLNQNIRNVSTVESGFGGVQVSQGRDYVTLENARRLMPNEYTLNGQLGYISLNQRLSNDEVLAVAYQYTVNGRVYQVGEFSNDGIESTQGGNIGDPNPDPNPDPNAPQPGESQNIVVKMLKSNIVNVNQPIWDLMMKNIYSLGAFQLEQEDFRLNILYTDPSPLNYITAAEGNSEFPATPLPEDVDQTTLLKVFNLDRLNYNNDPQQGGDGFFDFLPGLTVDTQNGRVIFTTVEPFGEHLFDELSTSGSSENYDVPATYNANQNKYVFRSLYRTTKTVAEQEDSDKNKFQLKGTYKSSGADGISIGAFNIPQGSVTVTAGGRLLAEGVDYTVNYQLGRVQILDQALLNSNTPIQITTENNTVFGQQTKRFTGLNVEHQFNENFLIGATYLNLNERPLTQKTNLSSEPINNTIFGFNANYSTKVPFLTRLVNKLPNIDTDVESNLSLRGEFAYLMPGSPKVADFDGKTTVYVDDFEGSQTMLDVKAPLSWHLASTPVDFGGELENNNPAYNFNRAKLAWYTIDPIFYSTQRPNGISNDDLSSYKTRRLFINEIFPDTDIVQGQTQAVFSLDLSYFPSERGPYNYNPETGGTNDLPNPSSRWAGITRELNTTDFEKSNVEYIQFWVLDPFIYDENATNNGGQLRFNLGSISEDILKTGRKQYENGLPPDGGTEGTRETVYGKVPTNQSLVYAFDTQGQQRTNQDIGLDGANDAEEASLFPLFGGLPDPAGDNYTYFLQAEGDIVTRYKNYNGTQGNSPVEVTDTNRGSTTLPDVEDYNRDNTMNTVNSYFEYEIDLFPGMNVDNNPYITDVRELEVNLQNNETQSVRWVQFKIPISSPDRAVNGITDFRSIRFMRMFLTDFEEDITFRFGTLDLVRGDYRRYTQSLNPAGTLPANSNTTFEVESVSIEENAGRQPIPYVLPPGVEREELINNNSNIRQNEQSLALRVCGLEPEDGRSVYKNYNIDMRQYKNLEMFIHAESLVNQIALNDGDLVAFMRLGNDLNQNFYEVEIPLNLTNFGATSPEEIWPVENRMNLPLKLLQEVKSIVLGNPEAYDLSEIVYFNESELEGSLGGPENDMRIGIKGNPSYGNVRTIMIGVKNATDAEICGEVWVNELRLTELNNEGGWAAVASMDVNLADFASVSAIGKRTTVGFGSIEQGPNERSLEDVQQYDVVTNVNVGQLLPQNWGIQVPFNYAIGEELITPLYDPEFQDIELDARIDNAESAEERDQIRDQSVDYTKRQSINFIGVRKERTGDKKPQPYDVENITLSYSYNQVDHNSFEIEESLEQNMMLGATYDYSFTPKPVEPFKKNDSLFRSSYLQLLKDFNFNYLPTNISASTNITRQYNEQKFREINLLPGNIGLPTLYQRNFLFDWQYAMNYNLTNSLRFNFNASNNRIVKNYIDENGIINNEIGVWDGLFDVGEPNQHYQTLQVNYDLPFNKIPFLRFIRATYSYTGNYQWQRGSDLFRNIELELEDGTTGVFDLGNTIQNSNTHRINSTLDMNNLYRYIGLTKRRPTRASSQGAGEESGAGDRGAGSRADRGRGGDEKSNGDENESGEQTVGFSNRDGESGAGGAAGQRGQDGAPRLSGGDKTYNTLIGLLTSVKRFQFNYQENNGIYMPGYLPSVGFMGSLRPSAGFAFGGQGEIRDLAARKGWLTIYPEFNEQYTEVENVQFDYQSNIELFPDFKIDLNGSRTYSESFAENYIVRNDQYRSLAPRTFGNFNISTILIKTAFATSDENSSETFQDFRNNRLLVANRLAEEFYGTSDFPVAEDGYPVGFGKNNQAVLLPAFISAYSGTDASSVKTGIFRDVPIPNWELRYTGLMRLGWFKQNFKRFSIQHGYRADYTVNQFETNLDYDRNDPTQVDQSGNFKNETLLSNVNLLEQFSPLIKLDFEMQNSVRILTEIRKDRALSLSFANNLLTEIQGMEYIVGLGYRIKDLRIGTSFGGTQQILRSDLNFKLDLSLRDNKTIIRYLDVENSQVTAGQTIYGIQFTADYALSKNLTALFYYDHTYSEYAVSTAFPQTTIRGGITLRYNFGN
ncbi:T9SS outer membrane translocon Sov/SprA [Planktosalinus lacus]|uniref:T9SS outer membrane translocon Sov/SprA n=1 Tax=Planktosalinus lacus TaxID=1526573 RepID=UPI003570B85D